MHVKFFFLEYCANTKLNVLLRGKGDGRKGIVLDDQCDKFNEG